MTYETLGNRNASKGIQEIFIYVNDVTNNVFTPMFLFSFFLIVFLGSYFTAERVRGRGDWFISFIVAGYTTSGLAIILSFIPGLIDITTIIVTLSVSFIGTIILFLTKER